MSGFTNPATENFIAQIRPVFVLGQVMIRLAERGYELRHIADKETATEQLRNVSLAEIRSLSQFTANGAFRPLKSSPNLASGWLTKEELEFCLNQRRQLLALEKLSAAGINLANTTEEE